MYYYRGMIKTCTICGKPYKTKEGRQKTCGKACGNELRKAHVPIPRSMATPQKQQFHTTSELPPVESLPAEYVKQCHDYWAGLTGDGPLTRRIG